MISCAVLGGCSRIDDITTSLAVSRSTVTGMSRSRKNHTYEFIVARVHIDSNDVCFTL